MNFLLKFTVFSMRLILYGLSVICLLVLFEGISEGYGILHPPAYALFTGLCLYSLLGALHLTSLPPKIWQMVFLLLWCICLILSVLYFIYRLGASDYEHTAYGVAALVAFEIYHYLIRQLSRYYFTRFP